MSSKKPLYSLQVTSQISSSHQLRNYVGKCEELHGHNFQIELIVQGRKLQPDTEILIDFKELKSKLNSILEELDHKHLNNLPQFQTINPSSENIARYIYKQMEKLLDHEDIWIYSVSVSEKNSSKAIYMED